MREAELINQSNSPSTSEVGLNFPPHRPAAAHGSYRLVPQTGTKGRHWYRFMSKTWTNAHFQQPKGRETETIGTG